MRTHLAKESFLGTHTVSGRQTYILAEPGFILLAVKIEASFVSPLSRSKRNHRHSGSFQVSLDFSMASNQTARGISRPN